jgi:hypothetical protein
VTDDLAEIHDIFEKPDVSQYLKNIKQKHPDFSKRCWTEETMRFLYVWLEARSVDIPTLRRAAIDKPTLERVEIASQLVADRAQDNERAAEYMEKIIAYDSFLALQALLGYLKANAIACMGVEPAEREQELLQKQCGDEPATHEDWIRSMSVNIQTLLNQLPQGGVVFVISPLALQAKQIAAYLQLQNRPCEIKVVEILEDCKVLMQQIEATYLPSKAGLVPAKQAAGRKPSAVDHAATVVVAPTAVAQVGMWGSSAAGGAAAGSDNTTLNCTPVYASF